MSIIKVNPDDQESFTITTNPKRTYISSSAGVVGSVYVHARRSKIEKNVAPSSAFVDATHDDSDINQLLSAVKKVAYTSQFQTKNFQGVMESYLDKVNEQNISAHKFKALDIIRFTPSFNFTSNTMRKLYVKDVLMRYYKTSYPTSHWAYTNYNSLNFFTSSTVPSGSALLYPNVEGPPSQFHEGYVSGTYSLSGAFSFDFYINPRYKQDSQDKEYRAGTIFHLSSSYAVSLVSGSARDENGKAAGFRLQLQLSHSAGILPSVAKNGNYPNDLIFLSDDNSLSWNKWHHVVIRWGTNLVNGGTGSFNIDGLDKGYFAIPSSTITPRLSGEGAPDVLCVGNFYEGRNSGSDALSYFFATDPAKRDGLVELINDGSPTNEPASYSFSHPLNAELHDVAIKRYYMDDLDISVSASVGPVSLDDSVAFYLPPFFTQTSSLRQDVNGYGGILQTPFIAADGTTTTPFNVAMAYGVGGHFINIENYVKDFASNTHPRLHLMTGSVLDTGTTPALTANDIIYLNPFNVRRNLLIMPCDDGNFIPNYNLLVREIEMQNAVDDYNNQNFSFVGLSNMLSTASLLFGTAFTDVEGAKAASAGDFAKESIGFTPEDPAVPAGDAYKKFISGVKKQIQDGNYAPGIATDAPLIIFQRTLDPSSDQVTFFDISNLYYGKRILPGSFMITDSNISGSAGVMKVTLRDNGLGNIYRADSLTTHAAWNSVGNIFYDEGVVVIKNPHLYFFGKEQYEISFRGEQNIHTLKFEVVAPRNQINSSSNPNFTKLPANGYITDPDPDYVYITGLHFHDKDLNVVAKTQLAQPIVKRHGDRIMFKVTMDF